MNMAENIDKTIFHLPEPDELDRFFFRSAVFEAIENEIGFRGGGGGGDVY